MRPDCFGVEFLDAQGSSCPHTECLLYDECKQVHMTGIGVINERRNRIKEERDYDKKLKRIVKKQRKDFFNKLLDGGSQSPGKKSGYKKPGRLMYKDEGTPRDAFVYEVRKILQELGCQVRATKCLHSFKQVDRFLLKVDTRRKNSIVAYIDDDLAEVLSDRGLECRSLYDSESPNFPEYLSWAVSVSNQTNLNRFIGALRECYFPEE